MKKEYIDLGLLIIFVRLLILWCFECLYRYVEGFLKLKIICFLK